MAFGDADASTPAPVKANAVSKAATTASFTPPVGAWLVAFAAHDTAGGNLTNTSAVTDSQGGTWTQVVVHSKQSDGAGANNGHIAVSVRRVTVSAAMTVTTTGTNTNNPAGLYCHVVTGADAVTLMDATPTEGHNINALVSLAITVATTGARAFLIASDWNLAANMTAGASQTALVSDGIGAPDMRWAVIVQNATSSAGSVTMSTGSPATGNQNNYAVVALRPAAGGGAPSGDASLAVTASFGSTASTAKPVDASLALTASVSAAATKAVPASASIAVVASLAATAVPTRIGAAALAVTVSVATSATRAAPVAASVSVVATIATTAVDAGTTTASLALTVALGASATVGVPGAPVVPGSIVSGETSAVVWAVSVGGVIRASDVAASPIGVTERAGVIHGV